MIFRILYDGIDLYEDGLENLVLNPSIEMELNTAGSCTFTLPPTHPMWGEVQVFSGDVEVYENGELIFFGRIINIDKNWNNERICECEGALAFLNDTYYDGKYSWRIDEEHPGGWTVGDFFRDVLNHHNLFVPTNRKIYPGEVDQYLDSYIVTREVEWEKTLDILSKMCIDTNGGWFFLRKDPSDNKIYMDWKLDFSVSTEQPVQFGLNLLDISVGYHGEDIVTGVIARGKQLDNGNYVDLMEYEDVDEEHGVRHTLGEKVLYFADSYDIHGAVVQVHDFSDALDKDELFVEAKNWLIKKNTEVASIEVSAAELGYFGDSMYPIFRVGDLVNVYDDVHFIETQTTTYPMYKISMELNTGKKKITIGTPPKKELTQIYATDTDSTGNSGTKAGTSSGSSGSGSSDGVTDVKMNGESVVNNHIASFNAVTTNQMNAAINRATQNLTTKDYVDGRVVANPQNAATEDLTKIKIGNDIFNVAGGTEVVANPSDPATDDLNTIQIGNAVYEIPEGGTEVEANPSESATDDLNTIKIGNIVYDIPGGGSSTNYGKFKCDVLFNTPTTTSAWANPIEICSEEKAKEYDMIYLVTRFTDGTSNAFISNSYLVNSIGQSSDDDWMMGIRSNSAWTNTESFIYLSFDNSKLKFYTNTGNSSTLYKVYGLKFENKLINRSDIYSEEERMIGRWTDGKLLYQRTIIKDLTLSSSWQNYYDLTGIDLVNVEINKLIRDDEPIPLVFSNIGVGSWIKRDGYLKFCVQGSQASEGWVLKSVTIQYTKTTDTPGSGFLPEDPQMVMMSDYYSEDEQVVGRWTDGKPLYQKTILYTSTGSGTTYSLSLGISNVEMISLVNSNFNNSGVPLPYVHGTAASNNIGGFFTIGVSDTTFDFRIGSSMQGYGSNGFVTVQYTKTTDAPGTGPTKGNLIYLPALYSEEEREVGVWTDGKPVYQRTWMNLNINVTNDWTSTGITISDIDDIILTTGTRIDTQCTISLNAVIQSGGVVKISKDTNGYTGVNSLTIQYTKTTDQPGSGKYLPDGQLAHHYSTSEKVVGTWIDGSTVYERTWDLSSSPVQLRYNDWVDSGISSSEGIEHIIDAKCLESRYNLIPSVEVMAGAGGYPVGLNCVTNTSQRQVGYLTLQYTKST